MRWQHRTDQGELSCTQGLFDPRIKLSQFFLKNKQQTVKNELQGSGNTAQTDLTWSCFIQCEIIQRNENI